MSECHDCGAAPGTNLDCPTCSRWAAGLGAETEGLTARLARDHGVNEATIIEILADADAARGKGDAHAALDRVRETVAKYDAAFSVLREYLARQAVDARTNGMLMSACCMMMVMDHGRVAGASNAAELGRLLGIEKQTVSKCLNLMLKRTGMERLPGQRDEEARRNMSAARKTQLKKGNEDEQ